MTRIIGRLSWLWVSVAMATPLNATAQEEAEADDASAQNEAEAPKASPDAETQSAAQGSATQTESTPDVHWQFGIALNLLSYQRASFDLEPINSGQPFPGYLERTNYGPSGGSVILEPGYIVSNRLALGILLDIGSGLNESRLKGINFSISQSDASLAVGPRVAYYLFPKSRIRPFGTLAFGYTFTPSKQAGQGLRLTMYQGFAGLGLSFFAHPNFSFDTSVRAAYGIGSGYVDTGVLKNASISGSIYTLMWTLGTTGWLM